MRSGPPGLLASLERGVLVGILLATCAAVLFAARNDFAPLQAPLTFGLVFWRHFAAIGIGVGLCAAVVGFVLARVSGRAGALRVALALPVAAFAALLLLHNLRAIADLARLGPPARFRFLLPASAALSAAGLLAALLQREDRRAAARSLALLAVACGLGALWPAGEPEVAPAAGALAPRPGAASSAGPRLLVVGMDGASWALIDKLAARGELPNLAALRARSAWGPLGSFEPTRSPIIWTTIATGRLPDEHGVRGFTHTRIRGVAQPLPTLRPLKRMGFPLLYEELVRRREIFEAPVTSAVRKVPAYWSIASARGVPVDVVNWWATWPAEPVLGHVVSERAYYSTLDGDPGADQAGLTSPDSLYREIAPLLMRPDQVAYEDARRFLPQLTPEQYETLRTAPQTTRKDIEAGLTYFVSMNETASRAALHLMEQGRRRYGAPGDTLVLFRLVDMACHTSIQYSELVDEHLGASPEQLARYGQVVSEAYRRMDRTLGALVSAFGEDGNVVVVSDHGWTLQNDGGRRSWGHRKAPDGILLASGPAFRPGRVEGVTVYDLMPLLLRVKGFPIADDLAGRVPEQILSPSVLSVPEQRIASYGRRGDLEAASGSSAVDEEMLDRLRALGYIQ